MENMLQRRRNRDWIEGDCHPSITLEDFLKIEDRDMQKFIFLKGAINHYPPTMTVVDDEDKLAYFYSDKTLKLSGKGAFYAKHATREYIVYDKKTKKVRLSNAHLNVFNQLMSDHFDVDLVRKWLPKPTPTFLKKVFEGKINTLGDIIQYHKSYTIRNKAISLETIFKFMVANEKHLINLVEDPENIPCGMQLARLLPEELSRAMLFKFKIEDVGTIRETCNRWMLTQGEKYDKEFGRRDAEDGNNISQKASF